MSLITRMRKQNAIYWPPGAPDAFGRLVPGALVELVLAAKNYRVRWEDVNQEVVDAQGTVFISQAMVYVPQLPDGSEVKLEGYLWLGDRSDLLSETNPRANPGANPIKKVDKLPNLKASEFLRTVWL